MIKTANLTANTETSISGLGGTHCRINNNTAGTLYASAKSGIEAGGDDVTAIPAGRGDYVVGAQGTVYLLSSSGGSVQVEGTDVLNRPFDNAAVTGGVAVGNPVVMDGLQGGVPFSDMVVKGKNLIPYPYSMPSRTLYGVKITVNNDGTITANGTATADIWFLIFSDEKLKGGTYTVSGNPADGNLKYHTNLVWVDSSGNNRWNADKGDGITFTMPDSDNVKMSILIYKGTVCDNLIFRPQLETGDTPTAYEPPITGRDLTVGVSGKNLLTYPYVNTTKTINGITFTDNGDGSVSVNGTATASTVFYLVDAIYLYHGVYTLSGCPAGGSSTTYRLQAATSDMTFGFIDMGDGFTKNVTSNVTLTQIRIAINADTVCDNLIFRPQLELGDTATAYEPYHGAQYTITPDSNPYTVPDDIRQQDGLNVVTASAGTLEVVGVRKNAALKKVWDKLDELTTAVIVSTSELSE